MMVEKNSSNSVGTGIGFPSLLTVLFIGLKLTNVIDWSWIWVLSPLWITAILAVVILVQIVIIAIVKDL